MNWSVAKIGTIYQKPAQAIGLSTPPIGCVLYLPGLPGGGNKIYDRSPYGNNGTITGAVWKRLPSGLWCLDFDGGDDEVALPSAVYQAFSNTDDFTMVVWFYVDGTILGTTSRSIMGFVGDNVSLQPMMHISQSKIDEKLSATIRQTADATLNSAKSGSALSTGWHFAALRHDASDNNHVYLHLDGVDEDDDNTNALTFAGTDFFEGHIGALGPDGAAPDLFWKDKIALPRIYNRFLSALEIQNHFNREKHLFGVW